MKWILLVEDDLSLINGLSFAVKKQGYTLDVAHTKDEADRLWENGAYDLVILDVSLPDGSGFDICKRIRQASKVPIMFLTAMDEETDIIMGLDIGAMTISQNRSSWRCLCRESMPCLEGARILIRRIRN